MSVGRVALLSLEPWDEVWRRNQHLAVQLVAQGLVERLLFVEPGTPGRARLRSPLPGVTVLTPRRRLPKRLGGNRATGLALRFGALRSADLIWVNDPEVGSAAVRRGQPAVYDVTDDWREVPVTPRARRRIVRGEDALATRASTVVCSEVLQDRWADRYGLHPEVVHNGIDADAWQVDERVGLEGPGPHVGYVGTLHEERVDIELAVALALSPAVGTLHFVGPVALGSRAHERLLAAGAILHGPVASGAVPAWTCSFDVLVCPHLVTPFTMSLDAIKSYEYLASGRPVVATPSSGFQRLQAPQLRVVDAASLVEAVVAVLAEPPLAADRTVGTWAQRAREFRAAWPL